MPTATRPRAGRAPLDTDRPLQTPEDDAGRSALTPDGVGWPPPLDAQALEDLIDGIYHRAVMIEHCQQDGEAHRRALSDAVRALAVETQQACDALRALLWPDEDDAGVA
jgi:hypothetical protein